MVIPPQPKSVVTAPEPLLLPAADESSDDDDWLSKTCSVFARGRTHPPNLLANETKIALVEVTPAKRKSAALAERKRIRNHQILPQKLPTYETKQAPVEDPPGRKLTALAERRRKRSRVTIDVSSDAENHRNAVPQERRSSVIDLASESDSECDDISSSRAMAGKNLANGTGKAPTDAKVEEIIIDDSEDDNDKNQNAIPKLPGKETLPDPIEVKSDPGEIQVKGCRSNEITIDDSENEYNDLLNGTDSVLGMKKTLVPNPKQTETALNPFKAKTIPEEIKSRRLLHLEGITEDIDRALQLLLWEVGFGYNVYAHQFEAIRFVAGLVPTYPVPSNATKRQKTFDEVAASLAAYDTEGSNCRSTALEMAAIEFDSRLNSDDNTTVRYTHTLPTKGMLLADEMGLGKTIEALAGAALRKAMMCYSGDKNLPTLIVSPQDGIQNQWYETLVKSGVKPSSIVIWGDTNAQTKRRQERYADMWIENTVGDTAACSRNHKQSYILCTRYKIQSELRKLFDQYNFSTSLNSDSSRKGKYKATTLFRSVPWDLIGMLRNQYRADKGKEKNKYILSQETGRGRERGQDCVTRLVRNGRIHLGTNRQVASQFTFQTIIVDEAHFCKNVLAYWGLGLALLGIQSKRNVLLTGTPYNNGPSDMSALMTYIDPAHRAAKVGWWEDAVSSSSNGSGGDDKAGAADAVSEWRREYLLRRTKDILLQKLPPRLKKEIDVLAIPSELSIYQVYEGKFLNALRQLRKNMGEASPEARHKAKKVFEMMMACMACMRMALVHPILLNGREMTIHFSPSRRHLLKREECPTKCVFCNSDPTKMAEDDAVKKNNTTENPDDTSGQQTLTHDIDNVDEEVLALAGNARTNMDLDDDQLDDDDFEGDYEAKSKKERELEEREKGRIVALGPEFCRASGSQCRHFAHEKCIEEHRKHGNFSCPRCHDLESRMREKLPHSTYCEEVSTHIDDPKSGGFTASAKIEEAIKWFQIVPKNDKAIFLSFFKGSLDLIEGILVSKFGIDCARYDGDVSKEVRTKDLERFKTSNNCRVLLATVQSGGTGLNITEANHVCFLDRWFNPCVHDQAESRCHRIGQKKEVNIAYLDINCTIDIVMKRINVLKEGNASVILADGTSLGDRWSLGYKNVSGVIGNTLNALRDMRDEAIKSNGDAPLPPYLESDLEIKLEGATKAKMKLDVKGEDGEQTVKSEARVYPETLSFLDQMKNIYKQGFNLPLDGRPNLAGTKSKTEEQLTSASSMRTFSHSRAALDASLVHRNSHNNDSKELPLGASTLRHPAHDGKSSSLHKDSYLNRFSQAHASSKLTQGRERIKVKFETEFAKCTRALMVYLEQRDKRMYRQAKIIINDCVERNKRQERGFGNIEIAMKHRLKELVGEHLWRKANYPLDHVIKDRQRQQTGAIPEMLRHAPSSRDMVKKRPHKAPISQHLGSSLSQSTSYGSKRFIPTSTVAQATSKRSRFSSGLSAIVSRKKKTKEFMRRKKRGDLSNSANLQQLR